MNNGGNIEFIIRGFYGDKEISPSNISLSMFSDFAKDISEILTSIHQLKKESISIAITEGSFKILAFVTISTIHIFKAELETLNTSADFALIEDKKRSKIFEDWYEKTKAHNHLEFEILFPENHSGIKINAERTFKRSEKEIWAEGEHYLYGEVTDWGGAQQSNIHFRTDDNKSYIIACTKEDIKNEKENRVYQRGAVMVIANQNIETGELKDLRLVSFVEYDPVYNEQEWQAIEEKSRDIWADVPDHVAWVRNLRSDDE